eukprot:4141237-Prymnesium_polylepis.1
MAFTAKDAKVLQDLRSVDFVQRSSEQAALFKRVAQALFAWSKQQEGKQLGPLEELAVEGFDEEGVWQQLQLRNTPLLRFVDNQIKRERKSAASAEAAEAQAAAASAGSNGVGEKEEDEEDEEQEGEEEGEKE